MAWIVICLAIGALCPTRQTFAVDTKASPERSQKISGRVLTLDTFIEKVLADGSESRIPSPLAELIGVTKDIPALDEEILENQATDAMYHLFHLMAERASDTGEARPFGLALHSVREWPEKSEGYWFRASLKGKLEKAIIISGKRDEQGQAIKGTGTTAEKDVNSSEIKKRFQHELDLWLKKSYLKKEWKSAEFVAGVLKKKS